MTEQIQYISDKIEPWMPGYNMKPTSDPIQLNVGAANRKLYLAGPITGLSYTGATDWRDYVAKKLPSYITPVSPMRGKKYLEGTEAIATSYEHIPLSCAKGITCRDRHGVMSCDAVLANMLGAKSVSIGTTMEIAWADMIRKPIILVMEKNGNLHDHPMIKEVCGFWVYSLDDAIAMADALLMTGV